MAPPRARKKSQGRRKIEMKLIEDENARTVTFSKRRVGLFRKATELSVMCGAQIALIIFSLGGRAYSFGHPDVDSVIGRFLNRNPMANSQDSVQGMRIRAARLQELKEQCDQMNEEVEAKKRRGREIEAELEGSPYRITQETLDAMNYEQLKELQAKMEKLRDYVLLCANGPPQECHDGPPNLMNDNSPAAPSPVKGTGPATPSEVDLANVDWNEGDASPIPYDWLKL